jgi:hypothetical protein
VFVILLTLGRPEDEEERDEERRRAAMKPAGPAPRPIARAGTWPGGSSGEQTVTPPGSRVRESG